MPRFLQIPLLIVIAIVLLFLAIRVVTTAISLIFWILAVILIGYVALQLFRGNGR